MIAVLLASAAAVGALMLAMWLISVAIKDASIVDIIWGPGFVLVAWVAFVVGDGSSARRTLLAILVSIWGLRLGGYLAKRNLGKGEDYRYQAMREKHGARFSLVSLYTVFGIQGLLMWIVSLPVQVAATDPTPSDLGLLDVAGVVAWLIGLTFEAVGDAQLARFKADPANKGAVMDRGLWRYTRHPNYFGDFMIWWGIYLVALSTGSAWWTFIGPVVMSTLLMRVSGVAMLEKTIGSRRPGYDEYAARTSAFFPRPPKRA